MTWVLIIFAFLAQGNAAGGVSTAVTRVDYKTEAGCKAAAQALNAPDTGTGNNAGWTIIAKCAPAEN
jgi:hypothetical protein